MAYRLKSQDMTILSSTPYATPNAAKVYAPMKDVLQSRELFLDYRNRLRPGDTVRLTEFADKSHRRVLAIAEVLIIEVGDDFVDYAKIGAVRTIPAAKEVEAA